MRYIFALVLLSLFLTPNAAWPQAVSVKLSGYLSNPASSDGVIYFAASTSNLYAAQASDGSSLHGFPVDIAAATHNGSSLDCRNPDARPSVFSGSLGKAIYLETARHGIVKVWLDGRVAWVNSLDATSPIGGWSSPAVTPTGEVIAEVKTSDNVYIVKLRETDGTISIMSPPLSVGYFNFISSPAVVGNEVYVTVSPYPAALNHKNVTVLNLSDLSVRATFVGSSFDEGPPYVRGGGVYVGSNAVGGATVFKLNAATLAPDELFGKGVFINKPGVTAVLPDVVGGGIGACEVSASPTSADRDPGGTIYASVGMGTVARVAAINAVTGSVRVLYSTSGQGSPGMVVSSKNVIAFGDGKTLQLFGVDGGHNASYPLPGYPSRPCYDPTTNRFFVTTQPDSTGTSYLLGFDSP